ncbi:MBL fold metallo-hydrolase [Curtobacterium sp. MCPF17_011]|uniref:MBL fold metallo-hydrolase n=1 Tax=unclassified Curtobacterium TaxID=257496 RepID=UPI000D9F1EB1|nr:MULTISPECIES: MBL fold metallo-hydrolase [unclassified Curtobacterium]PYY38279.1 MBL fold metallo-hydrolase [Curtobacterium sp. MCBD17_030]PZF14875.1 MBL fold metallo-hydrolase [Curtobacterium sp. MCPF17_011]
MLVTKLEHACLVVEQDGDRLVIDPGAYTRPVEVSGVVAVVVTHEHPDHGTAEQLDRILDRNPGIPVFGPAGVASALAAAVEVDVVTDGDTRTVGAFTLSFHGTRHQLIHSSVPVVDNTGVFVNSTLFHPGDAYIDPGAPVEVFAAPVGAPWLKIGELMDHLLAVAPRRAIPIHEATLSDIGFAGHTDRIRQVVEPAGEVVVLAPGESFTV